MSNNATRSLAIFSFFPGRKEPRFSGILWPRQWPPVAAFGKFGLNIAMGRGRGTGERGERKEERKQGAINGTLTVNRFAKGLDIAPEDCKAKAACQTRMKNKRKMELDLSFFVR